MSRSSKRIVCRVRVDDSAKVVEFTWSEGSASFKPYALNGEQVEDFRANVQAARDQLLAVVRSMSDGSRIVTFLSTSAPVTSSPTRVTTCTTSCLTGPLATASTWKRSPHGCETSPGQGRSRAWRSSATVSPGSPPGTWSTTSSPMRMRFAERHACRRSRLSGGCATTSAAASPSIRFAACPCPRSLMS